MTDEPAGRKNRSARPRRTKKLANAAICVSFVALAGGEPLIVSRDAGQGRVLLVTTSADADWGNFPLRPLFLPLMHRAVKMLAGGGAGSDPGQGCFVCHTNKD